MAKPPAIKLAPPPAPASRLLLLRQWLRRNLTMSIIISLTVAIAILLANSAAGYYALSIVYKNKLTDTWAIMFLEVERQGKQLTDELRSNIQPISTDTAKAPDAVLKINSKGRITVIQGSFGKAPTAADFGLDNVSAITRLREAPVFNVLEFSGRFYVGRFEGTSTPEEVQLNLWKLPTELFATALARRAQDDSSVYMLTRQGKLLASNRPDIKTVNVGRRPLVQMFIAAPLREGQLEFKSPDKQDIYGFFYEVPKTNIVMFSEIEKVKALASLESIIGRAVAVLALIVFLSVLLLQWPLSQITGPVRDLVRLSQRVGQGDFAVAVSHQGFGELSTLTRAFTIMSRSLMAREESIRILMEEQTQKVRLEAELAIASGIQSNLLPQHSLPEDCGAEVAARYIPAGECAGDWYTYYHNAKLKESVVVIADVSGHGAGASMFTAMIACLFDQFRVDADRSFPLLEFAGTANGVVGRLGQFNWHVTMLILRYIHDDQQLEVLFAGHTPPMILYPAETNLKSRAALGPSSPIGVAPETFKPNIQRFPFPKGSSVLSYTDGLTEATSEKGRAFGSRRLRELFFNNEKRNAAQAVNRVIEDWEMYRGKVPASDDTCVVVLRAI